jgi:hypothetical protein
MKNKFKPNTIMKKLLLILLIATVSIQNTRAKIYVMPQSKYILEADIIVYGKIQSVSDTGFYVKILQNVVNYNTKKKQKGKLLFVSHISAYFKSNTEQRYPSFDRKPEIGEMYIFLLEFRGNIPNPRVFNYDFGIPTRLDKTTNKPICYVNGLLGNEVELAVFIEGIKLLKQCFFKNPSTSFLKNSCDDQTTKKYIMQNKAFRIWHNQLIQSPY